MEHYGQISVLVTTERLSIWEITGKIWVLLGVYIKPFFDIFCLYIGSADRAIVKEQLPQHPPKHYPDVVFESSKMHP